MAEDDSFQLTVRVDEQDLDFSRCVSCNFLRAFRNASRLLMREHDVVASAGKFLDDSCQKLLKSNVGCSRCRCNFC